MIPSFDAPGAAPRENPLQHVLDARLATLRHELQRSATLAYQRETGLRDFDGIVLWHVGVRSDPKASEIALAVQRDKAQVSRALARLTDAGLISRESLRAPLRLTPSGRAGYRRVEALLRDRNEALLAGLSRADRQFLDRMLDTLIEVANAILVDELRLAAASEGLSEPAPAPFRRPRFDMASREREPGYLVIPDIDALLASYRTSAEAAYTRVTRLPPLDWRMLSHVEMWQPVTLTELAASLDRDKSHVGRGAARLVELGLLERHKQVKREKQRGVGHDALTTTPLGKAACDVIAAEALRRDRTTIDAIGGAERRRLEAILDRLEDNSRAMLEAERELAASPRARAPRKMFGAKTVRDARSARDAS